MAGFAYTSKRGSRAFGDKLAKLVRRGRITQARYLLHEREARCGPSQWNPAYGVLREGGARCSLSGVRLGR